MTHDIEGVRGPELSVSHRRGAVVARLTGDERDHRLGLIEGLLCAYGDVDDPTHNDYEFLVAQIRAVLTCPVPLKHSTDTDAELVGEPSAPDSRSNGWDGSRWRLMIRNAFDLGMEAGIGFAAGAANIPNEDGEDGGEPC